MTLKEAQKKLATYDYGLMEATQTVTRNRHEDKEFSSCKIRIANYAMEFSIKEQSFEMCFKLLDGFLDHVIAARQKDGR